MQPQAPARHAPLYVARYRPRVRGVFGAAALVLLAHGVDLAHARGPNWPALAVRVAWALLLVTLATVLLRGTTKARVRVASRISNFGSAALFLALLAVTGRSGSPLFPFSHVLAIILPLVLPELLGTAMAGAALLLAGTFAMLVQDGASGDALLAWAHAGVVALLVGLVFGLAHRRTQREAAAAARARQEALEANQRLVVELREALASVKTLRGLLPVCAWCRRVRDDRGYWDQLEAYVAAHSDAEFSHGMCPDCYRTRYPEGAGER